MLTRMGAEKRAHAFDLALRAQRGEGRMNEAWKLARLWTEEMEIALYEKAYPAEAEKLSKSRHPASNPAGGPQKSLTDVITSDEFYKAFFDAYAFESLAAASALLGVPEYAPSQYTMTTEMIRETWAHGTPFGAWLDTHPAVGQATLRSVWDAVKAQRELAWMDHYLPESSPDNVPDLPQTYAESAGMAGHAHAHGQMPISALAPLLDDSIPEALTPREHAQGMIDRFLELYPQYRGRRVTMLDEDATDHTGEEHPHAGCIFVDDECIDVSVADVKGQLASTPPNDNGQVLELDHYFVPAAKMYNAPEGMCYCGYPPEAHRNPTDREKAEQLGKTLDMLAMVSISVPTDTIASWSMEDQQKVYHWAIQQHLIASDNEFDEDELLERPKVLVEAILESQRKKKKPRAAS